MKTKLKKHFENLNELLKDNQTKNGTPVTYHKYIGGIFKWEEYPAIIVNTIGSQVDVLVYFDNYVATITKVRHEDFMRTGEGYWSFIE